jgi:hypothetical protein
MGMVWNISDESLELMKEGIQVYKEIRDEFTTEEQDQR